MDSLADRGQSLVRIGGLFCIGAAFVPLLPTGHSVVGIVRELWSGSILAGLIAAVVLGAPSVFGAAAFALGLRSPLNRGSRRQLKRATAWLLLACACAAAACLWLHHGIGRWLWTAAILANAVVHGVARPNGGRTAAKLQLRAGAGLVIATCLFLRVQALGGLFYGGAVELALVGALLIHGGAGRLTKVGAASVEPGSGYVDMLALWRGLWGGLSRPVPGPLIWEPI